MSLLDDFMLGLELRDPAHDGPRPLDFGVSNDTKTLLLLADWWTAGWGMGTGLVVVTGVLNPKTRRFDGIESDLCVATASDETWALQLKHARERTDILRSDYYEALRELQDFEPDFDLMPWVELMLARPVIDVAARIAQRNELRPVGVIRVLDSDGSVVDALAIDARGSAATLLEEGWLALFADQWAGYAEPARPQIAEFLGWLAGQTPYGPFSIEQPRISSEAGDLESLVSRAQTRTSTT